MHLLADQRRRRLVAEQPRAGRVAEDADAVQIDAVDRLSRRVEEQEDALFPVRELLACGDQRRDVARDRGDADEACDPFRIGENATETSRGCRPS
jgi:hypothetical protein